MTGSRAGAPLLSEEAKSQSFTQASMPLLSAATKSSKLRVGNKVGLTTLQGVEYIISIMGVLYFVVSAD